MLVKNLKKLEGVIVDEKKKLEGKQSQTCQDQAGALEVKLENLVQSHEIDAQGAKDRHKEVGQESGHPGLEMPPEEINHQGQQAEAEGEQKSNHQSRPKKGQEG